MGTLPGYFSYLLRIWQETDGDCRYWRASLEGAGEDERRGFLELEDLFRFIDQITRKEIGKDIHLPAIDSPEKPGALSRFE